MVLTRAQKKERPGVDRDWRLSDFDVGRPLGKGAFGRVYLARDKNKHVPLVLKIIFKNPLKTHKMEEYLVTEITNHSHLIHPNILRLYNYFHDEKRIYVMLELAFHGEVYKELQRRGRFEEIDAAKYIYQVSDALEYCHQKKVVHRDLKPENLLFDEDYNIKLADFGWSVHSSNRRRTFCGTMDYMAPELVQNHSHTFPVDYWCVGVLLFEFLTGNAPFYARNEIDTYKNIITGEFSAPEYLSEGAVDLVRKLLQRVPSQRLDLNGVMCHPWITEQLAARKHSQNNDSV
ncbi:unnamed protein product [Bursaphelenchus xylophilus]|uniref:Aurora kinase n=1 Tax=Bursaphelenchus xylophilus TaxID=6326 RepID=A0A1I7RMZ1_BURXY|nr:unnamed protein product [Bursaphelenchus xylophilus]CAG9125332.1 unnamed protein product [Bursaphelenchus xylophilus]